MKSLSKDELYFMELLEHETGAKANDVLISDDGVVFIVEPGNLGRAIGKQGVNIQRLRGQLGDRKVDVVEYAPDLRQFVANAFAPANVTEVTVDERGGRKLVSVRVDAADKGVAIGRGGEKIKRAKALVQRLFDAEDVKVL